MQILCLLALSNKLENIGVWDQGKNGPVRAQHFPFLINDKFIKACSLCVKNITKLIHFWRRSGYVGTAAVSVFAVREESEKMQLVLV